MKPGDLVRIHPARSRDQYGDLEVYNLFNPAGFRNIIGTFTANEVGIFISESGSDVHDVKVMVNGVIGVTPSQFIQVVE